MSLIRRVKSFSSRKTLKSQDDSEDKNVRIRRKTKLARNKSVSLENVPLRLELEKNPLFLKQREKTESEIVLKRRETNVTKHVKFLEKRASMSLDENNFTKCWGNVENSEKPRFDVKLRQNPPRFRDRSRYQTVDVTNSNLEKMTDNSSVVHWLKTLRFQVESYDLDLEIVGDDIQMNYEDDEVYENLWECYNYSEPELKLKYGDICRSSVLFEESVEKLQILPLVFECLDFELSDDVVMWRKQLRHTYCGEDEDFLESEDLIKEFKEKVDDEHANSNKPGNFPVSEEDRQSQVEVRRHSTLKNAQRPQTFSPALVSNSPKRPDNFDARGPFKLQIGNEICTSVKSNERLKLTDGDLCVYNNNNQKIRVVRRNVEIQKGTKLVAKKIIHMYDSHNLIYSFHFENSRDLKNFIDMERSRSPSYLNEKTSIKSRLLKLLGKRSSRDLLELKGIIKNEAIFGNTLHDLYEITKHEIPEFIVKIVELIEEPENITCLGLYRTSANLAIVQKIRCEVDCGRLEILDIYKRDVDVLCGTLKLFFRELKEPLISYEVYLKLQAVIEEGSNECIESIVNSLPKANKETLLFILRHLLKVCRHKEENKMDIHNIAVSWGPSLIAIPDNCSDLVIQTTQFYKVTEFLLNHYNNSESDLVKKVDGSDEIIKLFICRIEENVKSEGIYRKSGSSTKIDRILKRIEDLDKSKYDVHDLCGAFKRFVANLEIPLVPQTVFEQYCKDCDNLLSENLTKDRVRQSLEKSLKKKSLDSLLEHFRKVLEFEKCNKISKNILADAWSSVLVHSNRRFHGFFDILLGLNLNLPDLLIENVNLRVRESRYDNVPEDIEEDVRGEADFLDDKTDYKTKL